MQHTQIMEPEEIKLLREDFLSQDELFLLKFMNSFNRKRNIEWAELSSRMKKAPQDEQKLHHMLLKESIWKIEDKLNVIMESIADHEAELIRLRRLISLSAQRLDLLIERSKPNKRAQNGN